MTQIDSSPSTPASPLGVLRRHATFRRLWLGALVSAFGDNLTWIALTWLVLERSGTGAAVGAVLLCYALPAIVTGPIFGRLLDRHQPRTIMLIDNVVRACLVAAIPALAFAGWLQLWMIFLLALLSGALAPATQIGMRVLVPAMMPRDDLEAANGALAWTYQVPIVFAPALSGAIIALWSAPTSLALDALSFLVIAWALLRVPDISRAPQAHTEATSKRATSLHVLRDYPVVILVTSLSLAFFFAYGPLEASLAVHAKERLQVNADGFGLLWSVLGVGALLGSLGVPWLSRRRKPGLVLAIIVALWGVTQFSIGLSVSLPMALVSMFIGGVIWGPYTALETSLIQRVVPPERHGQVFGARLSLTTPAAPLGTALGGLALTVLQPNMVIMISGLLCVLVGLINANRATLRNLTRA